MISGQLPNADEHSSCRIVGKILRQLNRSCDRSSRAIKFLDEKSDTLGLAVPGMPAESPGMEMGGTPVACDVLAFKKDGSRVVFARH